jgi:hypothetical protein
MGRDGVGGNEIAETGKSIWLVASENQCNLRACPCSCNPGRKAAQQVYCLPTIGFELTQLEISSTAFKGFTPLNLKP